MFATPSNSLLKEGTKHLSGLEESNLKNIEACRNLSQITRTSLGPNGMNKMVISSHEKLFVTSDAATIIKELEVVHPAAKMLVMASNMQEQEVGDGTNFVLIFGGELLFQAESLIRMGLHTSDIIAGYAKASKKALEILNELKVEEIKDLKDEKAVLPYLRSVVGAKQYSVVDQLAPLIAKACIAVLPKDPTHFSVDNVRVAKILGGGITDTSLVRGFVIPRDAEGTIKHVTNAKIAVLIAGIDIAKPETKGTVLIKNAEQLMNYSKEEEKLMEETIKQIAQSGANVLVSGAAISDLAMHFLERYKIMVVKVPSKFQLRRVCKATGASALVRLGAPTAEELGSADVVTVQELGSTKVVVFRNDSDGSLISTIVVRASTQNLLDDIERAVDDGVNAYKTLTKERRLVAGAGASEIELAKRLAAYGSSATGLDQYAIKKYAEAFEVFPRTLAENTGLNATSVISNLYAAHSSGKINDGVNVGIDDDEHVKDAVAAGVFDSLLTKQWAIKYATDATTTILSVDQIIMAKPAGGPKPRDMRAADADDDNGMGF